MSAQENGTSNGPEPKRVPRRKFLRYSVAGGELLLAVFAPKKQGHSLEAGAFTTAIATYLGRSDSMLLGAGAVVLVEAAQDSVTVINGKESSLGHQETPKFPKPAKPSPGKVNI